MRRILKLQNCERVGPYQTEIALAMLKCQNLPLVLIFLNNYFSAMHKWERLGSLEWKESLQPFKVEVLR